MQPSSRFLFINSVIPSSLMCPRRICQRSVLLGSVLATLAAETEPCKVQPLKTYKFEGFRSPSKHTRELLDTFTTPPEPVYLSPSLSSVLNKIRFLFIPGMCLTFFSVRIMPSWVDLNRANANNLTRVIISHAHKITVLQRLIGNEPISVSADMKRTCRIKNLLIMTSNT